MSTIATQRIIISDKATGMLFIPKNMIDQKTFKISWRLKAKIALLFSFVSLVQIRNRETPINRNRKIQTGEKTSFGGLKEGFEMALYHPRTAGMVKTAPINPAAWQIIMLAKNLAKFFRASALAGIKNFKKFFIFFVLSLLVFKLERGFSIII